MKRVLFLLSVFMLSAVIHVNAHVVSGVVKDESGGGLDGVAVMVKGTPYGTLTSPQGYYILITETGGEILIFSFIGLCQLEEKIEGRSRVDVVLKEDWKEEKPQTK